MTNTLKELTKIYLLCQKVIIKRDESELDIFANVSDEMQQIARSVRLAIAYIEWKGKLRLINPKSIKAVFPEKGMPYMDKIGYIKDLLKAEMIKVEEVEKYSLAIEEIIKATVLIEHFIKYEELKNSER